VRNSTRSRFHRTTVSGSRSDAGGQPGQPSGQRREHRPVSPGQARSAHLATSHRILVAEHQNLRILRRGASGQQPEPGHKLPEDQIQQSNSHSWRSCPTTTVQQYRTSALRMTCSAPTGEPSRRSRPRTIEIPAPGDARTQQAALDAGSQYRACLRPKPPPQPLGTRGRCGPAASAPGGLR
jgi:hypothetical protein